jgi:hypothetical protein
MTARPNWLEREFLGLPVWEWLCYIGGFLIGLSGFVAVL